MKKNVRTLLGLLVASLFTWLLLETVSINEISQALGEAEHLYICYAISLFLLGYCCRIERWRLMLLQENKSLNWSKCAGPFMISVAANNLLPFRSGDLLRSFGFNKQLRINPATSITSILFERLLDVLMVLFFLGAALTYLSVDSISLLGIGGNLLTLISLLILFLLFSPNLIKPLARKLSKILSMVAPKLGNIIELEVDKVFIALDYMSKSQVILKLICWSFLAWIAEGFVFWFVALSLPSIINPSASWLALSIGTFSTLIPGAPGHIGTFDYFTSQAMAKLGNGAIESISYAFLVHTVLWFPASIAGGLFLMIKIFNKK